MATKLDVQQGTLALMILKTLEGMGPQHGYGIARRIEQVSGQRPPDASAQDDDPHARAPLRKRDSSPWAWRSPAFRMA